MKTYKLALTLMLTLAAQAQAQGMPQEAKPQVSENTDQIKALLDTTSNSKDQVLERLRNQGKAADGSVIPVEYQNADYRVKSPAVASRIEAALDQFRATLKSQILDPIGAHITRYNSIATSKQYSYEQKQPYLAIELKKINEDMIRLSGLYRQEVLKLYVAGGIEAFAVQRDGSVASRISCEEAGGYCLSYMSLVFPALEKGCATYSCVGLSASDQALLFKLVKEHFDRHIDFVLAEALKPGEEPTPAPAKQEFDRYGQPVGKPRIRIRLSSIDQRGWNEVIEGIGAIIQSPTYHPRSVQELPADITEALLPAGLEHARKVFNEDYKAARKSIVDPWIANESEAKGAEYYQNVLQICLLGKGLSPVPTPGIGCINRTEGDVIVKNLGRRRGYKYNDPGANRTARMAAFRVNQHLAQQESGVQPAPEATPAKR
ncbi:MAG TPA: hypothetical protein VM598_00180 [Bdellovibrionota bacterium]|nr:hypothetical protein [Bdellovibrionota bacterium]